MSGILENTTYLDPKYQHLEKYVLMAYKSLWTPMKYEKLIKEVDASYYYNRMSEVDKESVRRCLLSIAMVEDKVKSYWNSLHRYLPQTIISDVGSLFGFMETTHRRAYHSANEAFGIEPEEIEKHKILKDRLKYLNKHLEKGSFEPKNSVLKNLTLFTSLVEKGSLFPAFYILMSWSYANKGLHAIASLQESTSLEEIQHYSFGIDLINIIKKEYPEMWDSDIVEVVTKSIKTAQETEVKLIDWFFENGVPGHLTKKEVVNFLNYNFNTICEDLGLDLSFDFNEELYREKSEWMMVSLYNKEPDFFNMPKGGYSSTEEEIDIENFKF